MLKSDKKNQSSVNMGKFMLILIAFFFFFKYNSLQALTSPWSGS